MWLLPIEVSAYLKEVEFLIRILIAVLLGFAIGMERKMRFKEVGIRTHAIVAAGACLFMLISKYGFDDVADARFDAARVVAQVVSGIGFIGAGMIMHRKLSIHGLTTAAGVWITAGVGMAVGAGMYILAACATVMIILAQCVMHINCNFFKNKHYVQIQVVFVNTTNENEIVKKIFDVDRYLHVEAKKKEEGVVFSVVVRTDKTFDDAFIFKTLQEYPFIQSINRIDDD